MYSRSVKTGAFVLEAINALATTWYFNYLFFYMQAEFGFGGLGNLALSALNGFVYMFAAWFGGRFAQRHGYFFTLQLGFAVLIATLLVGGQVGTVAGHVVVLVVWTIGICFTWPTLEAIVSEHEPPARLQRMIGLYSIVFSSAGALASFTGGALFERLGKHSMFTVPAALHAVQLGLTWWLEKRAAAGGAHPQAEPVAVSAPPDLTEQLRSPVSPPTFLAMAWIANPFAYVAINTAIPLIPELARRLELSPGPAGFFCSIWFFARAAAFVVLWRWSGWHYRFRWLMSAYVAMGVCFAAILLGTQLWLIVLAQLLFGAALGLIYYSSLFYSMDVGETKGEHGGFHEAALGAGIFAGPAVGAATLHFFPEHPHSGIWAVSGLVVLGALVLAGLRWHGGRRRAP